jgi:ATP-dependent exoDNAse (exonuclease V) alpha subunit
MTEQTGIEAKTIHHLLEIDPKHGGFSRTEDNPLDCDFLIIDETSMVDVPLMNALTRAIPRSAALLLVADVDQLPSVGLGQVLADIIWAINGSTSCGSVCLMGLRRSRGASPRTRHSHLWQAFSKSTTRPSSPSSTPSLTMWPKLKRRRRNVPAL